LLVVVPLALIGTIADLAAATVLLLLAVFAVVNGALFVLKRRPGEPRGYFEISPLVPALGVAVCLILVGVRVVTGDLGAPVIAGVLLLGSAGIYALLRPRVNEALPPNPSL
jgi:amino acid transporter